MRSFWVGCGAVTGVNTGIMVSLVTFAQARDMSTAQGSYPISMLAMSAMVEKALFGWLGDRLDHRSRSCWG